MAHDDLTDDTFELEPSGAELGMTHSGARGTAPRGGGQSTLLLLAGFGCALSGLALSVGPIVSWKAAQIMVGLDYLGVHGGTLLLGGLVLMGLGMLRRGQHAIAVSADEAGGNTEVVEEMATDVVQMRHALDHMQHVTSQMQDEVGELRRFCEAEAQKRSAVPQPTQSDGQGDAVFRLAATIDKLGARIEERMKSQFATLQERLTSVESSFETGHESIEERIDQLAHSAVSEDSSEAPAAMEFAPPPAPTISQESFEAPVVAAPAPVAAAPVPVDSPLGVLDTIEPDEPQAPLTQPASQADFSQGLKLTDTQHYQAPSAALPTEPTQPASPWGGELQMEGAEATLSPEERQRLLAETRLRQSLQNMQRHPEQGSQDFTG